MTPEERWDLMFGASLYGTEREDFSLEDVIDQGDLNHYDKILRPSSHIHREPRPIAPPPGWTWSARVDRPASSPRQRVPDRLGLPPAEPVEPRPSRRGGRAENASSDTRLEPYPSAWCWDVCGYYRILGVHWKATRKELRDAYQRKNGEKHYLIRYALSQLLDRDLRREYDALPLGTVWLKDRYVQEFIKKRAADEARARSDRPRRWWGSQNPDSAVTPEDILGEWGFGLDRHPQPDDDEEASALLPSRPALSQAGSSRWPEQPWTSRWSYYELGWPSQSRVAMLPAWQDLLLRELGRHGIRISFAVGAAGKDNPEGFVVLRSPSTGSLIICLAGDAPSRAWAARAVVRAMSVLRRQSDR